MDASLATARVEHQDAYDTKVTWGMSLVAAGTQPLWLAMDVLTHSASDLPMLVVARTLFLFDNLAFAALAPRMKGSHVRWFAVINYWVAGLTIGVSVPGAGDAYAVYVLGFSLITWAAATAVAFPWRQHVLMELGLVFGFTVAHAALGTGRPIHDLVGAFAYLLTAVLLSMGAVEARYRTRRAAFDAIWSFHHQGRALVASQLAAESERQAREAQSAFLARMSHELRTPLNVITGYLAIIRDDMEDGAQPALEDLAHVELASEHLLHLLGDLLDASAIEEGQVPVSPTTADLHELLEPVVERLRIAARGKGLTLSYEGVPATIHHDPARLAQIVVALVGNAIKYTDEGSVAVTCRADREHFDIAVDDSGPGVAANETEHIFERFAQVDASSTRRHDGAGLGLSVARSLARHMGGDVVLEPKTEPGARFVLSLPLVQPEVVASTAG